MDVTGGVTTQGLCAAYAEMQANYQHLDWGKGVQICGGCMQVAFLCRRSENSGGGRDMPDKLGNVCTCSKKTRMGCVGMKMLIESGRKKKALCPACTLQEFSGSTDTMLRYVCECAIDLLHNECGCIDCCQRRQFYQNVTYGRTPKLMPRDLGWIFRSGRWIHDKMRVLQPLLADVWQLDRVPKEVYMYGLTPGLTIPDVASRTERLKYDGYEPTEEVLHYGDRPTFYQLGLDEPRYAGIISPDRVPFASHDWDTINWDSPMLNSEGCLDAGMMEVLYQIDDTAKIAKESVIPEKYFKPKPPQDQHVNSVAPPTIPDAPTRPPPEPIPPVLPPPVVSAPVGKDEAPASFDQPSDQGAPAAEQGVDDPADQSWEGWKHVGAASADADVEKSEPTQSEGSKGHGKRQWNNDSRRQRDFRDDTRGRDHGSRADDGGDKWRGNGAKGWSGYNAKGQNWSTARGYGRDEAWSSGGWPTGEYDRGDKPEDLPPVETLTGKGSLESLADDRRRGHHQQPSQGKLAFCDPGCAANPVHWKSWKVATGKPQPRN